VKRKFSNVSRKVFAILCAFMMTCATVTAAETNTPELSGKELYAIELLNAIGIYDGVDSIAGKEDFVRRDVMAYLAARIMGMSNVSYSGNSYFSDVDKGNFAYNSINILLHLSLIAIIGIQLKI